ncbi:MAG: acyl carrier protein [Clostridiales bacterium]|nr:acyl carrier protein [Clostridiales bacterium]
MIFEKIRKILSEQFDIDEDTITPETLIEDDLGADSLDIVDLMMSIESEFDLDMPDTDVEGIKSVGDLCSFIEANI